LKPQIKKLFDKWWDRAWPRYLSLNQSYVTEEAFRAGFKAGRTYEADQTTKVLSDLLRSYVHMINVNYDLEGRDPHKEAIVIAAVTLLKQREHK